MRLLVALGLVARGGWLAGWGESERERETENVKVKRERDKHENDRDRERKVESETVKLQLVYSVRLVSSFTNLVFRKYKIGIQTCV